MELLKVLRGEDVATRCKFTYVNREWNRKGCLLVPATLEQPSPTCFVCRNGTVELRLDVTAKTLADLLDIVKRELGFNEPSITVGSTGVWEEGDDAGDFSHLLERTLDKLPGGGVASGTTLSLEDFSQDLEVNVNVYHVDADDFDKDKEPGGFRLTGARPEAGPGAPAAAGGGGGAGGDSDSDDLEILDDDVAAVEAEDAAAAKPPPAKRSRKE